MGNRINASALLLSVVQLYLFIENLSIITLSAGRLAQNQEQLWNIQMGLKTSAQAWENILNFSLNNK
jgi:hypothetical protein